MRRNIILIFVFSILFYFQTDLALWPIYVTDKKGFDLIVMGIFQAVFVFSRFVFEVPSGVYSDRIGRVRTLMGSTIAILLSYIFILYGNSILTISIAYVLFGLATAFISGTLDAFLYDSLKSINQEYKFKLYNTNLYFVIMISFCFAMGFGWFVSTINMDYMYIANMGAIILAFITCILMKEPDCIEHSSNTIKKIISNSIITIKANRRLLYLIGFITITTAISNSAWTFSQKMLSQYGMSIKNVSAEAIFTTLLCGLAAQAGYFIEKKLGKMGSSIFVSIILVFPLIVLGITKNTYLIMTTLTLVTISLSFATPIYSDYINSEVDSSFRATVLSIQSLLAGIFALIFTTILGFTNSIALSFIIVGILAIPLYIFVIYKINATSY